MGFGKYKVGRKSSDAVTSLRMKLRPGKREDAATRKDGSMGAGGKNGI